MLSIRRIATNCVCLCVGMVLTHWTTSVYASNLLASAYRFVKQDNVLLAQQTIINFSSPIVCANGSSQTDCSYDPFSLAAKAILTENFCGPVLTTNTGQLGWIMQTNIAGTVTFAAPDAVTPCGMLIANSAADAEQAFLYLHGSDQAPGQNFLNDTYIGAKAWKMEFRFKTGATLTNYNPGAGFADSLAAFTNAGGRSHLILKYSTAASDTAWEIERNAADTVTTPCTASAAPTASTYYRFVVDNGTGSSTINFQLYSGTSISGATTTLFTACTSTFPSSAAGSGFYPFIGLQSVAINSVRNVFVYQFIASLGL